MYDVNFIKYYPVGECLAQTLVDHYSLLEEIDKEGWRARHLRRRLFCIVDITGTRRRGQGDARSRAGGHFFLSSDTTVPPNNGAALNIAHIIKNVMSSATEAELAGLYIMAREAVYIRIILEELGHKQPPTLLQTDNTMADAVINGKIQPKQTKAMDMRFHWLRDRECQQQFRIYWRPGKLNYADYWTKQNAFGLDRTHLNLELELRAKQVSNT